jgi:hypothetical protein
MGIQSCGNIKGQITTFKWSNELRAIEGKTGQIRIKK